MRITNLRAVQPRTAADPPDWRTSLGQILVMVDTDTGVRGLGMGGGGAAAIHVIESVLRPLLLGEDAHEIEALWQRMYRATLPYGRAGLVIMAISGVDLALWDARGKAEGRSVAELLGGARHERLPCYATGFAPEQAVADGYRALKLHLQRLPFPEALAVVARTRDLIGADIQLFTDAWGQWDLEQAVCAAEAFAEHDVGWLEEPLPPDDLAGYVELSRRSPVLIAGGEHDYTVRDFRALATSQALAIWQLDITWTGGLTQLRAIYSLAAEFGVRVVPHRGGEIWALPAIAALDAQPLVESGRPWITWLRGQPPITKGMIDVPERPGFGVEVEPDLLGF